MVAYQDPGGRVVQTTDLTPQERKTLKQMKIEPPKLIHQAG